MAQLDVSDIVCDPDFMDTTLVCERSAQTVGENGLAANTPSLVPFGGVVTSDKGDMLERLAAGERSTGSIMIHTRFALNDGKTGFTADVVRWRCRRYTVTNVQDYQHFGRGFVAATCELLPLSR